MDTNEKITIEYLKIQKMAFLYNALENGWSIKKNKDCYVFTRSHEGKKEVYLDSYLKNFIDNNANFDRILSFNENI